MSAQAITPALRAHRAAVVERLLVDLDLDALLVRMFDNVRWVSDALLCDYPEQLYDGYAAIVRRDGSVDVLSMFGDQVAEPQPAPFPDLPHVRSLVSLPACYSWGAAPDTFVAVLERALGPDVDRLGVDELPGAVQQSLKARSCVLVAAELQLRRAVKHPDEIALMRAGAAVLDRAVAAGLRVFAEGGSEREAGAAFAAVGYETGIEGISHLLVSTPQTDSVFPAHGSPYLGDHRLQPGESARIDAGFYTRGGYASDIARTVVRGTPSPTLTDAYTRLCEAYDQAIVALRAGTSSASFWNVARDRVESLGYTPYLALIGHGIGLRVTELPMLTGPAMRMEDVTFEEGMVIAVEYHVSHDGLPLSLEDVWLITPGEPESLTGASRSLTLEETR